MPSFQNRSGLKELLDEENVPFDAIRQNMKELDKINHLLGGHRITLKGFRLLIEDKKQPIWHVVEIGCGGGDNLRVIKDWAGKHKLNVQLTGIDINTECIAFAKTVKGNAGIHFITSDYRNAVLKQPADVIFSSLFCHHFSHQHLMEQLQWMYRHALHGFFINDLHRHPIAYYSIQWLTHLFSKSYLVKHDAPVSVLRGFRKAELIELVNAAGLHDVHMNWQWAFRWLIVCKKWS